jgi:hypothetical protein
LFVAISTPTPARVPVAVSTSDWYLAGDKYCVSEALDREEKNRMSLATV